MPKPCLGVGERADGVVGPGAGAFLEPKLQVASWVEKTTTRTFEKLLKSLVERIGIGIKI